MNHSTAGFWCLSAARASRVDGRAPAGGCWWRGAGRERSCPPPTVSLVSAVDQDEGRRSRGSPRRGRRRPARSAARLQKPISLSASVLAASLLERVDVDAVLELGDRGRRRCACRSSADRSGRAAAARRSSRSDAAANWSATSGRAAGGASTSPRATSISSASVSVTASPASASSSSPSAVTMPVDRADAARRGDDDRVAALHRAAGDRAGEAAEIEVRAVDPLHRQAERRAAALVLDVDASRDGRAASARRTRACAALGAETLSPKRAEIGIATQRAEAERLGEARESRRRSSSKRRLVEVDQVDLVDRQHDVADAEQRDDDRRGGGSGSARPCARRPA